MAIGDWFKPFRTPIAAQAEHTSGMPYPLWVDPNDLTEFGLRQRDEVARAHGIDPTTLPQPDRDPRLREGEVLLAFNPETLGLRPV